MTTPEKVREKAERMCKSSGCLFVSCIKQKGSNCQELYTAYQQCIKDQTNKILQINQN